MRDGSRDEHKGMRHCPSAVGTAQGIRDFPPPRNIQTGIVRAFHTVSVAQLLTDQKKNQFPKVFGNRGWKYLPGRGCAELELA